MADTELFADEPLLRAQRDRLLALLRDLAFEEREVTLSSGLKSSFYIDCRRVSLHAEGLFLIGQLVHAAVDRLAPQARGVGGMTLGADPLACAVSLVSFVAGRPLHAFLVRKEAKGHGTRQWLEGTSNLPQGSPVVILEDVVTTGASTLRAIERTRESGLEVARAVALVDREEGGRSEIERETPLTALFARRDFLS